LFPGSFSKIYTLHNSPFLLIIQSFQFFYRKGSMDTPLCHYL
jgi:hypothetical protein